MEPKIKKSRRFHKKIGKSYFPEKRTHYGGLTMFSGVPMVQKSLKIAENDEKNAPTGEKTYEKNACEKSRKKDVFHRFLDHFGEPGGGPGGARAPPGPPRGSPGGARGHPGGGRERPRPPRTDLCLILAHPSYTFPEK